MQTVYDILSALASVTIVSGVSEDRAAAWMTDNSPISLGDARVALSVTLPGDRVRCGAILVVARKADPVEAVALLGASIAADQEFDHDRALTHYRGLLGRLEDQQAAERQWREQHNLVPDPEPHTFHPESATATLERLDHKIEDLYTDEDVPEREESE
jgi:hypothetical protein